MKNAVLYVLFFIISFQSFSQISNTFKKKKTVKIEKITELNEDMVSDGTFGDTIAELYCPGITTNANVYTVNNKNYLFILNLEGLASIIEINSDGTTGRHIKEYDWSEGWKPKFYTINNKTYLFLLKYSTGTVHIHLMNNDGTVGEMILDNKWSKGWSNAEFYTANNQQFLFLLKRNTGLVHIHKINNDGSVGALINKYNWSKYWTTSEFYTIENQTYLFLYKGGVKKYGLSELEFFSNENDKGIVKIHKIKQDGTVGSLIMKRDWTEDWMCNIYSTNNKTYLNIAKFSGINRIHKIGDRGLVGELVKEENDITTPAILEFFTINKNTFALSIFNGRKATINKVK